MVRCCAAAAAVAAVALLLVLVPSTAMAQTADAYIDGAEAWTAFDCSGEVPIVVGSDAKAQSDIYSAIALAGAIGTDCVVLAGARGGVMPTAQQQRLDAAESGGYVVGGVSAVPAAKLAARTMVRIAGDDRWVTAQKVGAIAAGTDPDDVPDVPSRSGSVKSAGAHIQGAEGWFSSDCAGKVPIVVGSDAKAQSDIYSAITLAGAIGTDCVVLAGARGGVMPTAQQRRLDAAESGGYVVGGELAVPAAKIAGRDIARIAGADRWVTAHQVGQQANQQGSQSASSSQPSADNLASRVEKLEEAAAPHLVDIANAMRLTDKGKEVFYSTKIQIGYGPCICYSTAGVISVPILVPGYQYRVIGHLMHEFLHAVYYKNLVGSDQFDEITEELRQFYIDSDYLQYKIQNYIDGGDIPENPLQTNPTHRAFLTELHSIAAADINYESLSIMPKSLDNYYDQYFEDWQDLHRKTQKGYNEDFEHLDFP